MGGARWGAKKWAGWRVEGQHHRFAARLAGQLGGGLHQGLVAPGAPRRSCRWPRWARAAAAPARRRSADARGRPSWPPGYLSGAWVVKAPLLDSPSLSRCHRSMRGAAGLAGDGAAPLRRDAGAVRRGAAAGAGWDGRGGRGGGTGAGRPAAGVAADAPVRLPAARRPGGAGQPGLGPGGRGGGGVAGAAGLRGAASVADGADPGPGRARRGGRGGGRGRPGHRHRFAPPPGRGQWR
jgi:hypothetical protein